MHYIKNILLSLGEVGVVMSVVFLFLYTYLSYYSVTQIRVGELYLITDKYILYLWVALAWYILHMIYILTSVNTEKICKKYNVVVIK